MTQVSTAPPVERAAPPLRRRTGSVLRGETRSAWVLMSPYLLLLLVAGVVPIAYAVGTSFQTPDGGFGGVSSYGRVVTDFRFVDTFVNIFTVLAVWLPLMIVAIVGLALLIHASPGRYGSAVRFIYYLPGALGGIANFVLWVYLLNPAQSPIAFVWDWLGVETIKASVTSPGHLPVILAGMLFFQGVGTWIVIVNGGLNSISDDVLEAASLDGAGPLRLAWSVKLPMIRPWIGYAALMNLAYGFQLFLEPYLLNQVTSGAVDSQWTPTQLGFAFAFSAYDFPAAAAMSLVLLVITLLIGLLVVFKSGLFGEEER